MWGIIGGSGFEKFEHMVPVDDVDRGTPFGLASSGIKKVRIHNRECVFVSRHGQHHELLPSEVNYRANIFALKRAGVTRILAFSAVGSLQQELKPGEMVVIDQYIDRTKSLRAHTFLGDGIVGHVSFAKPTCSALESVIKKHAAGLNFAAHFHKTYLCIDGPGFSTRAESLSYRQIGAQIIGMTNVPEYALAREAGLCYLPCVFVTDYDCWDDSIPHVTLEEVMQVMRKNNSKAFKVVETMLQSTHEVGSCACHEGGLKNALMTPPEAIPTEKRDWLKVLMDRGGAAN